MQTTPFHLESIKLAWGKVRHQRNRPKRNGFDTSACFVRLRFSTQTLQEAPLSAWPRIDRPGPVSIHGRDYGFETHELSLTEHVCVLQAKAQAQCNLDLSGPVDLHTFPRVLGFVFNPVSFWYFHDREQNCQAILCEVNNTFGERHFYWLPSEDGRAVNHGRELFATKNFHVSPFFPTTGHYRFRFMDSVDRSVARIDYFDQEQLQLTTSVSGQLTHPTTAKWAQTLLRFGWSSMVVVIKIHWQALKLWLKGATFHTKPEPPKESLTEAKHTS